MLQPRTIDKALLSIVVPAYNEEEAIPPFLAVIKPILDRLECAWEIVFVDDGSRDATEAILALEAQQDSRIKAVSLARNFGKEAALSCGLTHVSGDAVIPMDVDLQDPPELILEMVDLWKAGHDVVLAVRSERNQDTWFKRFTAGGFYRVMNMMSSNAIVENAGDFRLMDRAVVDVVNKLPERNRFMKGILSWPGFRTTQIEFIRPERAHGESKWNYWKLWNFALDGIFSFSATPLRVWTYVGIVATLFAFAYMGYIVVRTWLLGVDVPGYASLLAVVLFFNGLLMISNGIQSEYIGRIFEEVKGRPIFVVGRRYGFDQDEDAPKDK